MPTTAPDPLNSLTQVVQRIEHLLDRAEAWLAPPPAAPDWSGAHAWRWRRRAGGGFLQPVQHTACLPFTDLQYIESQQRRILANTEQFVRGLPANNVLLSGARGTGKSSLVKACLRHFSGQGLRLIEVDRHDMTDFPELVDCVAQRPERFIVFCDDLSFETGDAGYKALKVVLDGSIAAQTENVLVYATSNRRHLLPEKMSDNLDVRPDEEGDLHPGETVEERISLSERFGLWIPFHAFSQEAYWGICSHWLLRLGAPGPDAVAAARPDALRWALERGSRSGRVAMQFARDYAGRHGWGGA